MSTAYSRHQTLGPFEAATDIGAVKHAGTCSYEPTTETYEVAGSGTNMWLGQDEFHFVYKRLKGTSYFRPRAISRSRRRSTSQAGLDDTKGPGTERTYVDVAVHGDGLTSMQFRRVAGVNTEEKTASLPEADVLHWNGEGHVCDVRGPVRTTIRFRSLEGVDLGDEVYVGLFVCAHNADAIEHAEFDNVRITVPAKTDFVPYRDYIGSNLEILDCDGPPQKHLPSGRLD